MIVLIFLTTMSSNISPSSSYRYLPAEKSPTYSYNSNTHLGRVASVIDVPHHVLIVYNSLYCSGTLIYSKIVLSTASCFRKRKKDPCIVKVGSNSMIDQGQVISVVEIIPHEYFGHNNRMDNDIAILVLETNVEFGPKVKKAIPVESDVALRDGIALEVSGWGSLNVQTQYTYKLLRSEMMILDKASCYNYYGNFISPSNFCAKYQAETYLSDNGGSAMYRNNLVGVLSFGATNKQEPFVAVFTNVSYFHKWIIMNSQRLLKKHCIEDVYDTSLPSLEKLGSID